MKRQRVGQHALLALMLVGCSNFPALLQDSEDYLQQLISENKYHKALQKIEQLSENDPLYPQRSALRKTINRQASQYEDRETEAITTLINNTEWQKAIARANQARKNLPESEAITAIQSELLRTRDQYIKQQQLQLAIAVAQHLPLELQLLQSLVKASDHDSKAPLAAVQSQLVASHATLMAAAREEIDRQNWRTADHYLQLALLIKDDTKLQDSLALTQKRINSELKLQETGNRSQREKLRISTVESLHDAIERGQLLEAQAILPQLIPWKDEPEEARLQNMLMSAVNVKVTQLSEQGQRMYTDGQLNSAIELWQQALALDPGNSSISDKLHRAKLFKANYDKLRRP
jgi:hypothetical protein